MCQGRPSQAVEGNSQEGSVADGWWDGIRPVWHQREDRVLAHILVCFSAYVLWKTLHQMTKSAGLGDEPRRIFEELGKISLVDVVLPTRSGVEIRRRCVSQPTEHQAILLQRLVVKLPRQITS